MSSDTQMLQTYRHDAHKTRGRSHSAGSRTLAGVEVNLEVPYGADGDAAALSRPSGKPDQTVANHDTHYRLSILTGASRYDPETFSLQNYETELHDLLAIDDAAAMHRAWLDSELMAAFAESVYHPYTSLKYHTLLVAALVDCYRSGTDFGDIHLVVDPADEIVTHRTVYTDGRLSLRLTGRETDRPWARLGSRPWRSWASTWGRLSGQPPLPVDHDKSAMLLDANLRRIQAWSTALQYLEDYTTWRGEQ